MKYFLLLLLLSTSLFSKDLILEVRHTIDGKEVVMGEIYDVYGIETKFDRLQYYFSHMEVVNSLQEEIDLDVDYLLVDINEERYSLGDIETEDIEKINFNFGLDRNTNHADPAQWPVGHPLALTTAAMHWGWASGYRFLAVEGYVKDIFQRWNNNFQYHLVGNQYFTELSHDIITEETDNEIIIKLDVELLEMLRNVSLTTNNVIHGAGGGCDLIHDNIVNGEVIKFIPTNIENESNIELNIFPNPANNHLNISISHEINNYSIEIFNINGELIKSINNTNRINISDLNNGSYYINIIHEGELIKSEKFIK